jgi:hypothetical protein
MLGRSRAGSLTRLYGVADALVLISSTNEDYRSVLELLAHDIIREIRVLEGCGILARKAVA